MGCDETIAVEACLRWPFQSTHPRGVRHDFRLSDDFAGLVSIHAPAWGATLGERGANGGGGVSIHAPAWGATTGRIMLPRPSSVSIHAPAWGATRYAPRQPWSGQAVSIHAPAWGATKWLYPKMTFLDGFNPRTRVGCDARHGAYIGREMTLVSIHAPAWGATLPSAARFPISTRFNPRTRVGCDSSAIIMATSWGVFQSTHPRGVRHAA